MPAPLHFFTVHGLSTATANGLEMIEHEASVDDLARPSHRLALGGAGLQGKRMQLAAHLGLERLIDDLVLLDPGFAAK